MSVSEPTSDVETKFCSRCLRSLPVNHFGVYRSSYDGFRSACKACRKLHEGPANAIRMHKAYINDPSSIKESNNRYRANASPEQRKSWTYLSRYGIRFEEFMSIVHEQNGRCASCNDILTLDKNTHIDHCHITNKIRGVLCRYCNTALGMLQDDPKRVTALLNYIERTDHVK